MPVKFLPAAFAIVVPCPHGKLFWSTSPSYTNEEPKTVTVACQDLSMKFMLEELRLTFDYITGFALLLEPGNEVAMDIHGIIIVAIFVLFAFLHVAIQFIVHASFSDDVNI